MVCGEGAEARVTREPTSPHYCDLTPPPPPPPPQNDARDHTTTELMAVISSPLTAESDVAYVASAFASCVHDAMGCGWLPRDSVMEDMVHMIQVFRGPWAVAEWNDEPLWDDVARSCGYTAGDLHGFTVFLQQVVAEMCSIRLREGMPGCDALRLLATALCLIVDGDPNGLVRYEETRGCVLFVARKTAENDVGDLEQNVVGNKEIADAPMIEKVLKESVVIADSPMIEQRRQQQRDETGRDVIDRLVESMLRCVVCAMCVAYAADVVREPLPVFTMDSRDSALHALRDKSCGVGIAIPIVDFTPEQILMDEVVIAGALVTRQQQPRYETRGAVPRLEGSMLWRWQAIANCLCDGDGDYVPIKDRHDTALHALRAETRAGYRREKDEALADHMQMQMESVMKENARLREMTIRLSREKDDLQELLDFHRSLQGVVGAVEAWWVTGRSGRGRSGSMVDDRGDTCRMGETVFDNVFNKVGIG